MQKKISASDLRIQIRHVLNEVSYSHAAYVVEKFGEPTAAIINIADFEFLQMAKQQSTSNSSLESGQNNGLQP
jgi:prevent-host-death family protein